MNGQIAQLIASDDPGDRQTVATVFGPSFQTMGAWRAFLRTQLPNGVSGQLESPAQRWKVETFQALFIACWIHHPVEKGTYMIDLVGASLPQRDVLKSAYDKLLKGRKSSHLSGSGRSASKKWDFLKGYEELLVQIELTKGRPYLLLKAEGHTTGVKGVVPHLRSWVHKRKHGYGLEASPALHALASADPRIEARAAENYAKGYGKLLKEVLGLRGKQVTVKDMTAALFARTGFNRYPPNFVMTATNEQLGQALLTFFNEANRVGPNGFMYRAGGAIKQDMVNDLREVAESLTGDGDRDMERVYREIRGKPAEIDASLQTFLATPGV